MSKERWYTSLSLPIIEFWEIETSHAMTRITCEAPCLVLITFMPEDPIACVLPKWQQVHFLWVHTHQWTKIRLERDRVEETGGVEEFGWPESDFWPIYLSVMSAEFGENRLIYKIWTPLNPSNICDGMSSLQLWFHPTLFKRVQSCRVGYDWIPFGFMAPTTSTTM
jgi:hypothetical protein